MTIEQGQDVAQEIKRTLRWLTYAVCTCLVLSLGVGVFAVSLALRINVEASRSTYALCTLRNDLAERVQQTETFLVTHPDGFAGIPKPALLQSLNGQKRTIRSLQGLHCPAPVIP